jgi:hypothetical protein
MTDTDTPTPHDVDHCWCDNCVELRTLRNEIVEAVKDGEGDIDTFTLQPARAAIAAATGQVSWRLFNGLKMKKFLLPLLALFLTTFCGGGPIYETIIVIDAGFVAGRCDPTDAGQSITQCYTNLQACLSEASNTAKSCIAACPPPGVRSGYMCPANCQSQGFQSQNFCQQGYCYCIGN